MGKAERNRAQSARERIAAQQAAARKAEQRRRALIAGGSVLAVLIVVVVLIVVKANQSPAKAPPPKSDAAIAPDLATIPAGTYDSVPYVPKAAAGKIPFIDFGGAFVDSGAQYPPSVLGTTGAEDPSHFGLTWAQIAADLRDPSSPVAQAVLGAANHITAAICKLTHGQPGNVCQSTAVTSVSKI